WSSDVCSSDLPSSTTTCGGSCTLQTPAIASGQRGWKRHPGGGLSKLGGSPGGTSLKVWALAASGSEIAARRARVYGCLGFFTRSLVTACSTIFAPYMTKIRCEK